MEEFRIECEFGDKSQSYRDGTKFYVDYDNFINHVMGYKFMMNNAGYVMYSSRKDGLCCKLLHRIIMDCPNDMVIDHIDHNKLNNMKSNLRICTKHQNNMNQSKPKNNKSGVLGVCWCKGKEKWEAHIALNNKRIHLGYFDNLEDASRARKDAEIKYFGEYRNKDNEK
jgi:hypothetical protein